MTRDVTSYFCTSHLAAAAGAGARSTPAGEFAKEIAGFEKPAGEIPRSRKSAM